MIKATGERVCFSFSNPTHRHSLLFTRVYLAVGHFYRLIVPEFHKHYIYYFNPRWPAVRLIKKEKRYKIVLTLLAMPSG